MKKKMITLLAVFFLLASYVPDLIVWGLSYAGDGNTVISCDNWYRISGANITENNPIIGVEVNAWAEYEINAESGTYAIYATVAASEGTVPRLSGSYEDGTEIGSAIVPGLGWTIDYAIGPNKTYKSEIFLGYAEFAEGRHILRFTAKDAPLRLFQIRMKGITRETENAFLTAVENSETTDDIEKLLAEYDGRLFTSYSELLAGIYYKDFIYSQMMMLPCDTVAELDSFFKQLCNQEKTEPVIKVMQNGESVAEISNGKFDVCIGARFDEKIKVLVAVYDDNTNRLKYLTYKDVYPYKREEIDGLTKEYGDEIKIFFWNDVEKLDPAKLPYMQSNIFVSNVGNDANDGSYSSPVATFQRAVELTKELNDVMPRNITVIFESGEYFVPETIYMDETNSGRDGYSVTYRSADINNPAVISGGITVDGWQDTDDDGIYEVTVSETVMDMRQLYIDGYPAQRAKGTYFFRGDQRWSDSETEYEEDGFTVKNDLFPKLLKPEDAELVYNIKWGLQRLPVKDIVYDMSQKTATVKMDQPHYSAATTMICGGGIQPGYGPRFYIENDLALLDEAGEFYFDKETKKLYYKPAQNQNMAETETVISQTEQLICATGKNGKINNINFENLVFKYGAYFTDVNEGGTVTFQAENLVDSSAGLNQNPVVAGKTLPAQIEFTNADNINIKDCELSCMGSTALSLGEGVTESKVEGCLFRDNGGGAVTIGTWKLDKTDSLDKVAKNVSVINNVITRQGIDFMFCPAVSAYYTSKTEIAHNSIFDVPYGGISIGWGWHRAIASEKDSEGNTVSYELPHTSELLDCGEHIIRNNHIEGVSKALADTGHIYMLGPMGAERYSGLEHLKDEDGNLLYPAEPWDYTEISGNYLSDSDDFGGIYFDSGADGVSVKNNVTDTTVNWIFHYDESNAKKVIVENNFSDSDNGHFVTPDRGTYEEANVCENKNWTFEAKGIIDNAGVTEEYKYLLEKISQPSWRESLLYSMPQTEAVSSKDIYISAADYSSFEVTDKNKEGPAIFNHDEYKVVGDYRPNESLTYTIDISEDKAGKYMLKFEYSTGPDTIAAKPKINVYVNSSWWPTIWDETLNYTEMAWNYNVTVELGTVTLNSGQNTLKLKNTGTSSFSYRGFILSPVE